MNEVTWFPVARIAELQSFIDRYWRPGHILARDAALLKWQHRCVARPDDLSVLVVWDQESIAGILGIIECPWNHFGRKGRAAWLTNWVVRPEPEYRSLGLGLLNRALSGGYDFLGTLGANAPALRMYELLKFHVVPRVHRWVRGVNRDELSRLLDHTGDFYDSEQRAAMTASARDWPAGSGPANIKWMDWSDAASQWETLWNENLAPTLLSIDRSASYLQWRYVDHPSARYQIRVAVNEQTRRATGLVVSRVIEVVGAPGRVLRVVDLLSERGMETAMAGELQRQAARANAALVDYYCTSRRNSEILTGSGFAPEESFAKPWPSLFDPLDCRRSYLTGAFMVRDMPQAELGSRIEDDQLYLTRSDCDQDRPN